MRTGHQQAIKMVLREFRVRGGMPPVRREESRRGPVPTYVGTPPPASMQERDSTLKGSNAVWLGYDPFRVEELVGASLTVGVAHGYVRKALRALRTLQGILEIVDEQRLWSQ